MTDSGSRVAAVVVTFDRRELLAEALRAIGEQSRRPDVVVVVDNASTDGTGQYVRETFGGSSGETETETGARIEGRSAIAVDLVSLSRNTGGAGGFAAGIARALGHHDAELLWLLDDDTIPGPRALEKLLDARERSAGPEARHEPAAVVASRVVWTDGRDHPMNTPRARPGASRAESAAAKAIGCMPIRSASFVSILVEGAAVRRSGLPIADYFLWNDDFEFTTRLLRRRTGLFCPDSVVVHKTKTFGGADADPGPRFFYEVRNKIWLFSRSRGLAPAERLLYAASTARRWSRTFVRSGDRATLWRGLLRGLAAGTRTAPRPTEEILRELEIDHL